jgi:hypothetical protein
VGRRGGGRSDAGGGDIGLDDMSSGQTDPDTPPASDQEVHTERTSAKEPAMPDVSMAFFVKFFNICLCESSMMGKVP